MIIGFLSLSAFISLLFATCIMHLPAAANPYVYYFLLGIESASPAIAAIIISSNDLRRFIIDKYCTRFNLLLCIVAFCLPMLMLALAKALSFPFNAAIVSPAKMMIIAWSLFAEELGWRGFLQERVERFVGSALTPLIVGAVWSAWHFHYFFTGAMTVPFWALTLGCVFESYGYYIITKQANGNVIPASIWHFSGNLFTNIFALNSDVNVGGMSSYILANLICGLYIIGYLVWSHQQATANPKE